MGALDRWGHWIGEVVGSVGSLSLLRLQRVVGSRVRSGVRWWLVPEVSFVEGDSVFCEEGSEFVLEGMFLVVLFL